jgi:hypothetical protein
LLAFGGFYGTGPGSHPPISPRQALSSFDGASNREAFKVGQPVAEPERSAVSMLFGGNRPNGETQHRVKKPLSNAAAILFEIL